jgi:hypothetical protein
MADTQVLEPKRPEAQPPEAQPNEGELPEATLEHVAGGLPKRRTVEVGLPADLCALPDNGESR